MSFEIPWGPLGYITYKRTYARRLDENNDSLTEEYPQNIDRILNACQTQLNTGFNNEELKKLREYFLKLKCSVAGRFKWQLGTKTVEQLGLMSLQNCAATLVNHPIRPFVWTMDALMLGCGVGYNIQREYVYELPKIKKAEIIRNDTKDADFIVPDSRTGWVRLLEKTLESHFYTGKSFSYSTILVRGKGESIKGFGGVASGPNELCWGIGEISKLLNSRSGKKLRPIDALDIMNIIAYIVVAGNVRRSAQLALGDMDDLQFLNAKRWDLGNIPNWRAFSNNSVVCNDINKLPEQFWSGYGGQGEPYGLVNLELSRSCGRLGQKKYKDLEIIGYNPCAEQGLNDKETCCLAEIFLPNVQNKEELKEITCFLYRICKHSLALPAHHEETEKIVHKNFRMGIGVTGYLQSSEEKKSWLSETYDYLREFDKQYSKKMKWPRSIKLTTCKPSGTLSLLPGVTPGIHPGFSQFFIRRIRMAANSKLVKVCREHGYFAEFQKNFDGTDDHNTVVIEFPCSYPEGTIFASDIKAIEQLEYVKRLQTDWSDNSVSCTIYYKKEELAEIKAWLKKNYNDSVKTVSFLLHKDHGFSQAPYEAISEERYLELKEKTKPIISCELKETDLLDEFECQTGVCPIK